MSDDSIRITRFEPKLGLVVAVIIGLLLLVGGGAVVLKIIDLLFMKPKSTGIPAWVIFAFILMALVVMIKKRRNK